MKLIILGAGGHAQEVLGIVWGMEDIRILGFVDETLPEDGEMFSRWPVFKAIPEIDGDTRFVCGIGSPSVKEYFENKVLDHLSYPLIHPTSVRMFQCIIEDGVVIGANCTLTTDIVIGRSTSINSNCVVSHNCRVGKRCHLSGGTILSGNVIIEDNVYIGSNATIRPKIHVGEGAIIGAGTVVVKDVESYTIVAGCPAKVLRIYKKGDKVHL